MKANEIYKIFYEEVLKLSGREVDADDIKQAIFWFGMDTQKALDVATQKLTEIKG